MADVVPFVHRVRPRYAEVDAQGVVFNAHWLTYFDEACTRWFDTMGFNPAEAFFRDFDVMLVKAVLEWQGPAGFDDLVDIAVETARLGSASFDVRYTATVGSRRFQCVESRRFRTISTSSLEKPRGSSPLIRW